MPEFSCSRRVRLTVLTLALAAAARVPAEPPENGLQPYSVQLHLHGSMSEGPGSMRAANVQARKLGIDVLWWTDHDWRVAYHTYAAGCDFEADGLSYPVSLSYPPGADLTGVRERMMEIAIKPQKRNGNVKATVARISAERAADGKKSLEIAAEAEGGSGFQPFFYELAANPRMRMKRALASGVRVEFSVYPENDLDRKTMVGMRLDLSQQPPGMEQGALIYVLTGLDQRELDAFGTASVKYVKLPFKPRQWNRFSVEPGRDAERLGLGGEDNSLFAASFGVLTAGPRAGAFFDGFRMFHRLSGEALLEKERGMAAKLEREYGVTNHVGQEFSYQTHMNAFGPVPMIDYTRHPGGLDAAESVALAHSHEGIISLNHYFGGAGAEKRIAGLIRTRAFGADLLECNPGQLQGFLRGWDALSRAGVPITGDGVSDSHSSTVGWFKGKNYVSWVWARSKSQADLISGLRAGDVYFGDPTQFHGRLRVVTGDGHHMGQVVRTSKPVHVVTLEADNLPAGARIIAVVDGEPRPVNPDGAGKRALTVDTTRRSFVRFEIQSAEGKPIVFTNPIFFVPAGDSVTVSAARSETCE